MVKQPNVSNGPHKARVSELSARAVVLYETIRDSETRDFLLRLPDHWLSAVEKRDVPEAEVMLSMIDEALAHAEAAVEAYGPGIRIWTGFRSQ